MDDLPILWRVRCFLEMWRRRLAKARAGVGFGHEIFWQFRDGRGRLLRAGWAVNAMSLEGEELLLRHNYQGTLTPVRYYAGLTNATLGESSTASHAIAGEPPQQAVPGQTVSTGYARVTLNKSSADWPVVESYQYMGATHKRTISKQFVFQNTEAQGGKPWPMVNQLFVLARTSDNPIVERLLFFIPLKQGEFQFQPQASLTISVMAGYGRVVV